MRPYLEAYNNIQESVEIFEASSYMKREILDDEGFNSPGYYTKEKNPTSVGSWMKERKEVFSEELIEKYGDYLIVVRPEGGHSLIIKHPNKENYFVVDDQYEIVERIPSKGVKKFKKHGLI